MYKFLDKYVGRYFNKYLVGFIIGCLFQISLEIFLLVPKFEDEIKQAKSESHQYYQMCVERNR